MRPIYIIFFVLNIYTIFSATGQKRDLVLEINGETSYQTSVIDSLNYTRAFKDLNSLKEHTSSIIDTLITKGYVDTHLKNLDKKDSISYKATLKLKNLYKYLKINLPDNTILKEYVNQTGIDIKEGAIRIETAFAKAYLKKLTSIAANNGNPFATFQLQNITKNKNSNLSAQLIFTSKNKRIIDDIVIKGYETFPSTFLKRYANIKKGSTFNQEELLNQNQRLNSLSFSSSIKEPEVLFKKDSTIVYFYLERQNTNRFDGFLGFATNEETNNLRLDGYIDLQLTNNLNYGETLLLNYKSDGEDQSQLNATIKLPYILKSPLGIEANLSLFRKDSTFATTTQSANIFYQISPHLTTGIGYTGIQSEDLQDDFTNITNTLDYNTTKFTSNIAYLKPQDNYFFPTKATFSINASLGNRETDTKERQIGLSIHGSTIINLNEKNSVYVNNVTQSLWSDNYLTNELYRFGGITSIRGFEENSIFANFVTTLNTEYRYVLNQSLYVQSIIDLGYFENQLTEQRLTLFSFGLGAGIRTKAGVLKVIIANGKNEKQNFDFNNTKLHFQLGIRF